MRYPLNLRRPNPDVFYLDTPIWIPYCLFPDRVTLIGTITHEPRQENPRIELRETDIHSGGLVNLNNGYSLSGLADFVGQASQSWADMSFIQTKTFIF